MTNEQENLWRQEYDDYIKSSPYRMSLIDIGIMNGVPMMTELEEIYLAGRKAAQVEFNAFLKNLNGGNETLAIYRIMQQEVDNLKLSNKAMSMTMEQDEAEITRLKKLIEQAIPWISFQIKLETFSEMSDFKRRQLEEYKQWLEEAKKEFRE